MSTEMAKSKYVSFSFTNHYAYANTENFHSKFIFHSFPEAI